MHRFRTPGLSESDGSETLTEFEMTKRNKYHIVPRLLTSYAFSIARYHFGCSPEVSTIFFLQISVPHDHAEFLCEQLLASKNEEVRLPN